MDNKIKTRGVILTQNAKLSLLNRDEVYKTSIKTYIYKLNPF